MGLHVTEEMNHQSSFLQLDTVLRSMGGNNLDMFLHSPEGLDSFMASLPQDQQKFILEEDMFTPLMSPATTPSSMGYLPCQSLSQPREVDITPLTSPAIMPQSTDWTSGDIYDQYEQLERAKQMITRRLSELHKKRPREEMTPATCHQQQQQQSPRYQQGVSPTTMTGPISPADSPCIEPVTISSLMNIKTSKTTITAPSTSPPPPPPRQQQRQQQQQQQQQQPLKRVRRSAPAAVEQHDHTPLPRPLKPLLISPTLGPGPSPLPLPLDAEHFLATRSNYQNLMEGKATALGISFSSSIKSGLEVRRTAHKAAEQKRRDSLKEWFDRLRHEVDEGYVKKNVPSDELEDETKPLSKVLLLKYAYEYISLLKSTIDERDMRINQLEQQLDHNDDDE